MTGNATVIESDVDDSRRRDTAMAEGRRNLLAYTLVAVVIGALLVGGAVVFTAMDDGPATYRIQVTTTDGSQTQRYSGGELRSFDKGAEYQEYPLTQAGPVTITARSSSNDRARAGCSILNHDGSVVLDARVGELGADGYLTATCTYDPSK